MIQKVFDLVKTKDVKTKYVYATRTMLTLTELNYSIESPSQMKAILDYGLNKERKFNIKSDPMNLLSKIYQNRIYLEEKSFAEMQKYKKYLQSVHSSKMVYVDVITQRFSIQKLVEDSLDNSSRFMYWAAYKFKSQNNNFKFDAFFD